VVVPSLDIEVVPGVCVVLLSPPVVVASVVDDDAPDVLSTFVGVLLSVAFVLEP
jgi:hypothetical protein